MAEATRCCYIQDIIPERCSQNHLHYAPSQGWRKVANTWESKSRKEICSLKGEVLGESVEGQARILAPEERAVAERPFIRRYGLLYHIAGEEKTLTGHAAVRRPCRP